MELHEMSIGELHQQLATGQISSLELTRNYLERINRHNPSLNAFITVTAEQALADAAAADKRIAAGDCRPLTGIPLALKDNFMTDGIRTTCASRMMENFVAPYSGTVWSRLKNDGAVLLGKLNMDEFAMGSTCENSFFGPARNPWNLEHISGGSSGGSAVAVSARLAAATLGTDTGGSIRQPASHCGSVGLKPSFGRVSRNGVVAYASSLDQVGPLTCNVADSAIMLQAIAGYDPAESTSVNCPAPDYEAALQQDLKGLRIGIPKEYLVDGLDPDVRSTVEQAIIRFRELGVELQEVSLPHTNYAVATYYLIGTAEASSNLARFTGTVYGHRAETASGLADLMKRSRAEGFGDEVKRRIMLGAFVLSSGYYEAYYMKGQKVRTLIKHDFDEAFKKVDLLLAPVAPTPAGRIGDKPDDLVQIYLSDLFTIPVNLSGCCAISVPAGFSRQGLPIGLQLIGRPFDESTILRGAYNFEQATEWRSRRVAI